ncbi:MAG: hypothetical protein LR008_02845 [Candidatus Pacebacteria bacterium]|nr:hypothetical protein [Candidatus Paceibacterota bacterium]
MEGAPKSEPDNIESVENQADWRELKKQAIVHAQEMIDAIKDFSSLDDEQQALSLESILSELADDNKNRFTAEVIALQLSITKENARHSEQMEKLEAAA